jgi:hypothetical protein
MLVTSVLVLISLTNFGGNILNAHNYSQGWEFKSLFA